MHRVDGPLPPRRLVIAERVDATAPSLAELGLLAPGLQVAWIGNRPPAGVTPLAARNARDALGREFDAVVFDTRDGLDADALGASAGTIRAGGALVLVTPPLDRWAHAPDPDAPRLGVADGETSRGGFLRRLVRVIRRHPHRRLLAGSAALTLRPRRRETVAAVDGTCTDDQRRAVEALVRLGHGRARRPVVLSADRGRGKSAALGLAAARLLRNGVERVVVTAPRRLAAEQVFAHAARVLPDARAGRFHVRIDGGEIVFRSPDELAHADEADSARMVLVDEAAAIPTPLLEALLLRYPRIAFASTVHGYEGTGRGFAVRFHAELDRHTPQWRRVQLSVPIRCAPDDPLERFVSDALLLDAGAAPDAVAGRAQPGTVSIAAVPRATLLSDERLLRELFGLLVLAHYRTRPFDLRMLLDTPSVRVFVASHEGHVVAAALVAIEGGFSEALAQAVWAGQRRPQGHLMPETLAAHLGLVKAARLKGARVVRIAVHPRAWRRGLGTQVLAALPGLLDEPVDYWGSAFGATEALLRFWRRAGYEPVRISVTRGATSGEHSALVIGHDRSAFGVRREARRCMAAQLPEQLADPLSRLEPDIAVALLRQLPLVPEPGEMEWSDALAFAVGRRVFEVVPGSLSRLLLWVLSREADGPLTRPQRHALVMKVLQKRPWQFCARQLEVPGRAQVLAFMRHGVGRLLESHAPVHLRALPEPPGGP